MAAGLSRLGSLATGTRKVAIFLGIAGPAGTVEVGKRVDLLLLEANPLPDIAYIRRQAGVRLRGR